MRRKHALRGLPSSQELLDYRRDPFDTFPPLSILARVGALATRKLDTRGVLGSAYGANYAPAYALSFSPDYSRILAVFC